MSRSQEQPRSPITSDSSDESDVMVSVASHGEASCLDSSSTRRPVSTLMPSAPHPSPRSSPESPSPLFLSPPEQKPRLRRLGVMTEESLCETRSSSSPTTPTPLKSPSPSTEELLKAAGIGKRKYEEILSTPVKKRSRSSQSTHDPDSQETLVLGFPEPPRSWGCNLEPYLEDVQCSRNLMDEFGDAVVSEDDVPHHVDDGDADAAQPVQPLGSARMQM